MRVQTSICVLLLAVAPVWAQQTNTPQPQQSAPPLYQQPGAQQPGAQGNDGSVAGDLSRALGVSSRTTMSPAIRVGQSFDSNTRLSPVEDGYEGVTSITGSLGLTSNTAHRQAGFSYAGGGIFYAKHGDQDSSFHQFAVSSAFDLRRWTLSTSDQFSYSPETPLGNPGYAGASLP